MKIPDFQSILLATVVPVQQVKHLLIVDLHVAHLHIGLIELGISGVEIYKSSPTF